MICVNMKHDHVIADEKNPDCRKSGHKPRNKPRKGKSK